MSAKEKRNFAIGVWVVLVALLLGISTLYPQGMVDGIDAKSFSCGLTTAVLLWLPALKGAYS